MKKVEKGFDVAIVLLDTKMNLISTPIKLNRSRLFGELGQRSNVGCLSTFSEGFSSETTAPIRIKFHMQPPSKW